jgi:hypothetical protein
MSASTRRRVQARRTAGWRKPPGAVWVARPSRWGNPFTVAGAIEHGYATTEAEARAVAVRHFRAWLLGEDPGDADVYDVGRHSYDRRWIREHLSHLVGKILVCWCPPRRPVSRRRAGRSRHHPQREQRDQGVCT